MPKAFSGVVGGNGDGEVNCTYQILDSIIVPAGIR